MNLPSATSHLEHEAIALIDRLTALWGQLDAAQTNVVESDPLRRCTLARLRHVQETNGVFLSIRRLFHIPDEVRVADFPQWLEDGMRRRLEEMLAEREMRLRNRRIEASQEEHQATDAICHAEGE